MTEFDLLAEGAMELYYALLRRDKYDEQHEIAEHLDVNRAELTFVLRGRKYKVRVVESERDE